MRTKPDNTTTTVLSCGIPAVHIYCRGSHVAYFGIAVKAGSRNESPGEYGLAHFVEHTIFKGTDKRRASHIIKRMEAVGGELNAYTTKEETVVYSVFPSGNLSRAAELIADLAANSRFPDVELDKEREVVADEIDSYLDTPSEAIFDDFENMIFAGSPLGHNILGSAESLRRFDSAACRSFIERHYRADNMVAFYSGPQSVGAVFRVMDAMLSCIPAGSGDKATFDVPVEVAPFEAVNNIPSHQAHCLCGARVPGYLSPDRTATAMLANILGGPGMNSLLNVELRERRGLVYSVEASTALFSDCGLLTIYFGCDPDDRVRCGELMRRTIDRLDRTLTPSRLEAAKKQYLGQLTVASESRENMVLGCARSLLWRGQIINPAETEARIRSLSAADILTAATPLLTNLSSLTFTPAE